MGNNIRCGSLINTWMLPFSNIIRPRRGAGSGTPMPIQLNISSEPTMPASPGEPLQRTPHTVCRNTVAPTAIGYTVTGKALHCGHLPQNSISGGPSFCSNPARWARCTCTPSKRPIALMPLPSKYIAMPCSFSACPEGGRLRQARSRACNHCGDKPGGRWCIRFYASG